MVKIYLSILIGFSFLMESTFVNARLLEDSLLFKQNFEEPTEKFLSISEWIKESERKDFKSRVPELAKREDIGRVLSCVGECRHFRDTGFTFSRHLSLVQEGDDIESGPNSMAYIYIHGGHLVRLAEQSSISLKEINISSNEVVLTIRLNQGHVAIFSRMPVPLKGELLPETDRAFIPIRPLEANLFPGEVDTEKELFHPEEIMSNYLEKINKKINENCKQDKGSRKFYVFFIMPNGSLWLENPMLEAYVSGGQSSFFKNHSLGIFYDESKIVEKNPRIQKGILRGFNNLELQDFDQDIWNQVSADGKLINPMPNNWGPFDLTKMFFLRPWSILFAREFLYEKYDLNKLGELSEHYNWGQKKLFERVRQSMDTSRRWETYNLPLRLKGPPREDISQLANEWINKHHQLSLETMATEMGRGALLSFKRDGRRLSEQKKWWYFEGQLKGKK